MNKKTILRKSFVLWLTCASAILFGVPAFANATTNFYLVAPSDSVPVGASFQVLVMADTNQPLNAYSVSVNFSSSSLTYDGANDSGSLITILQDNPALNGSTVSWSGGSLTPFDGANGKLMTLNFIARSPGTTKLYFGDDSYAYLANGKGTRIVPKTQGASVFVVRAGLGSGVPNIVTPPIDTTPPNVSAITLVRNSFDQSQKFLGFSVSDYGTGVKEINVRYRTAFFWSGWMNVKNPALLPGNAWAVDFQVIDNAGNVTEEFIYDWASFAWLMLGGTLVAIFLAGGLFMIIRKGLGKW